MKRIFWPLAVAQNPVIAFARIVTGFFLMYHGFEVFSASKMNEYMQWEMFKGGNGELMVYSGKGAELIAGVMLFLGFATRIGSLILIVTLSYIAFFVGNGRIWYEDQHPFLFVLLGIIFLFLGPGTFSLDHYLFRKTYK